MGKSVKYTVTMTPLISDDVYGTEVDISDRVELKGFPKIRKSIDAGDYDVGVYSYGDINLTCDNPNGFFNDVDDSRSIFNHVRDRAKVKIKFTETDKSADGEETSTIKFDGLINEEATRQNIEKDSIIFKILSFDSVIRNTKIPSGNVVNGQTFKNAIFAILNTARITSVLGVSLSNINPDLDLTIDDAAPFTNQPSKDGLDSLLRVSNSIMLIDSSNNVIIKSRDEDNTRSILNLFGKHDLHRRENIISINDFNTGLHRLFTSIVINTTDKTDSGLSQELGTRQKKISIDYITDATKEAQIADQLLNEFKSQKLELKITVPTKIVNDLELLDRVSIDYPLRVKPIKDKFFPVIGITEVADSDFPLPNVFGSIMIHRNTAWKVIQIEENPQKFDTMLKLRQRGTDLSDGVFGETGIAIVGFAVIGEDIIFAAGDPCDKWNPSVIGGAEVGCTKVA